LSRFIKAGRKTASGGYLFQLILLDRKLHLNCSLTREDRAKSTDTRDPRMILNESLWTYILKFIRIIPSNYEGLKEIESAFRIKSRIHLITDPINWDLGYLTPEMQKAFSTGEGRHGTQKWYMSMTHKGFKDVRMRKFGR